MSELVKQLTEIVFCHWKQKQKDYFSRVSVTENKNRQSVATDWRRQHCDSLTVSSQSRPRWKYTNKPNTNCRRFISRRRAATWTSTVWWAWSSTSTCIPVMHSRVQRSQQLKERPRATQTALTPASGHARRERLSRNWSTTTEQQTSGF